MSPPWFAQRNNAGIPPHPGLAPHFVRKILGHPSLTESYRDYANKLLALCDADQRVNVQKIHQHLFPLSTPASANSALNRFSLINDSAKNRACRCGRR